MIDTEKGRIELSRFTIDIAVRLALIAGVVYVSLLLLRPVAPMLLWAVILAVAVFPLYVLRVQRDRRRMAALVEADRAAEAAARESAIEALLHGDEPPKTGNEPSAQPPS